MSKKIFSPKRMNISKTVRRLVFERDSHRCVNCLRGKGDGVELVIDHVIPWMVKQDNSLENLQVLCRGCNAEKGARLPGESVEEERRRLNEYNLSIRSTPEFKDRLNRWHNRVREMVNEECWQRPWQEVMEKIDRDRWRKSTEKVWAMNRRRSVPRIMRETFNGSVSKEATVYEAYLDEYVKAYQ